MTDSEFEFAILKVAADGGINLSHARHGTFKPFIERLTAVGINLQTVDRNEIDKAIWSLIGRGLMWINMSQEVGIWMFYPTDRGYRLIRDELPNPDDPHSFLERLVNSSPKTSSVVKMYLSEALQCYVARLYLPSVVMLGVAAEAWAIETAALRAHWAGHPAPKLAAELSGRKMYSGKLEAFRRQLESDKNDLPQSLRDSAQLQIVAVLELIRITRNDAGHPTGREISKIECFSLLVTYSEAHRHLHSLREVFA